MTPGHCEGCGQPLTPNHSYHMPAGWHCRACVSKGKGYRDEPPRYYRKPRPVPGLGTRAGKRP